MAYINGKKLLQVVQSVGGGSGSNSAGCYYTNTQPTESSGTYTLDAINVVNGGTSDLKQDDLIFYIDSIDDNKVKEVYKILDASTSTLSLDKIGDVSGGGGKQLYQHHLIVNGFNIRYDGSERSSKLDIYYVADNDTIFSSISNMIAYFREHPTVVRGQAYASQFTTGGFDMIISKIYAGTNDNTLAMTCSRIDGSNYNTNNVDNEGASSGSSSIKVHVCSPL